MGYNVEEFLQYEKQYAKTRKALDYFLVAHWCHNGNKDEMMETLKVNLSLSKTEFEIASMIEAIKILKRNLTIKIGIKTEPT